MAGAWATVGYKYSQDCSPAVLQSSRHPATPATSKFLEGLGEKEREQARTKGRGWEANDASNLLLLISVIVMCYVWGRAPCYAFAYGVCLPIAMHPTEDHKQHSTWYSLGPAPPLPPTAHKYTLQRWHSHRQSVPGALSSEDSSEKCHLRSEEAIPTKWNLYEIIVSQNTPVPIAIPIALPIRIQLFQ